LFRSLVFIAFFGLTVSMCGASANAARIKIPLIREAVVRGGSIYLADLLPESAPPQVRVQAQNILVGQSPQPGSIRVLSSNAVVSLLSDEHLLMDVDIPDQILVRRSGRLLTKEEVTKAIHTTLRRNEMFNTVEVTPDSVRFSSSILVSEVNSDLRVTRVEMDRTLHVMKFWLVSGTDTALLPFMVMARPTVGTNELADMLGLPPISGSGAGIKASSNFVSFNPTRMENGATSTRPAQRPVIFVEAGKIAYLHLISGDRTEMFLTATPLERGALGQHIRAKIQNTGRILEAQVVGRGQLEAQY